MMVDYLVVLMADYSVHAMDNLKVEKRVLMKVVNLVV
jgi:hypothetical protein